MILPTLAAPALALQVPDNALAFFSGQVQELREPALAGVLAALGTHFASFLHLLYYIQKTPTSNQDGLQTGPRLAKAGPQQFKTCQELPKTGLVLNT